MVAATSTPEKTTVARRLDADADHLEQFVVNHPDPTAGIALRSELEAAVVARGHDRGDVLHLPELDE